MITISETNAFGSPLKERVRVVRTRASIADMRRRRPPSRICMSSFRTCWTIVRILRDCFARPLGLPDFPGLNRLCRRSLAIPDAIDPTLVSLLGDKIEPELLADDTGEKAAHRMLLPIG